MSYKCTSIEFVSNLINNSKNILILSGAGISAESNIPTFRGKGGIWKKWEATKLATPEAFQKSPRLVWEFYNYRREIVLNRKPNPGHFAVSDLQNMLKPHNINLEIITQNVDDLHRRAGSDNITKLHGDLFSVKCLSCKSSWDDYDSPIFKSFNNFENLHEIDSTLNSDIDLTSEILPKKFCKTCDKNTLIRPDVVWFGENLNPKILQKVDNILEKTDLCFVIGTSSVVYPAAGFSEILASNGVPIVEVNPYPALAENENENVYIVAEKSGEFLPKLVTLVEKSFSENLDKK